MLLVLPTMATQVRFFVCNNLLAPSINIAVQFNYIGDDRSAPTISGSALNYENYSLAQFHFHWGQQRGMGSEHTINDQSYSMEVSA